MRTRNRSYIRQLVLLFVGFLFVLGCGGTDRKTLMVSYRLAENQPELKYLVKNIRVLVTAEDLTMGDIYDKEQLGKDVDPAEPAALYFPETAKPVYGPESGPLNQGFAMGGDIPADFLLQSKLKNPVIEIQGLAYCANRELGKIQLFEVVARSRQQIPGVLTRNTVDDVQLEPFVLQGTTAAANCNANSQ